MKKTFLKIITIAIVLVLALLATNVNAATLTVNQEKMDKGDIVTVTVKTKEDVSSMEFKLTFDNTKYKYVEDSVKTELNVPGAAVSGNVLTVSAFDLGDTVTDTITVQFEAIDYGEAIPFSISGTEFIKSDDSELEDTFEKATINVTVAKVEEQPTKPVEPTDPVTPEEPTTPEKPTTQTEPSKPEEQPTKPVEPTDPVTPEEPTTPEKPTTPTEPSKSEGQPNKTENKEQYLDDNGNEIKNLPQTGSVVPAIGASIAVIAVAGTIAYKKMRNN